MSDSRDLAHVEPGQQPVRQSDNLLQQVIMAAKDPNIDATKMETLARLVNTQQDREREIEFNQSKNAAIMEMPVLTKDGRIIITKDGRSREQGRFARWEDIDRVVRPILSRHNLALSFDIAERQGGGMTVTPILSHTNGYTQRGGAFPVPPETSGSKNAAQAMGSAATYGKRYAGCAMLNIVTEGADDDGNLGRGTVVSLPYEREQTVLREAEQAAAEGRYQEWYTQQSPKDRGYLVTTGKHEEFGGQPVLEGPKPTPGPSQREDAPPARTGPETRPEPRQAADERDDRPPPPTEDPSPPTGGTGGSGGRRTPEQMVEDFETRLGAVKGSKGVIDLQAEPKVITWTEKLRDQYPDLHKRVEDACARRYAALVADERQRKRSQPDDGQLFDE